MHRRRTLWRACTLAGFVLVLAGSGPCPGDTGEEVLYCFVLNALTGGEHDVEGCAYTPGDYPAVRAYRDDLLAYRALGAGELTAPGRPTPRAFLMARYPDWPAREAVLRAQLALPPAPDDATR